MAMANKIFVQNGEKKALTELLGTSYPTVREALNGKESTQLHLKIRQVAKERGGLEKESAMSEELKEA